MAQTPGWPASSCWTRPRRKRTTSTGVVGGGWRAVLSSCRQRQTRSFHTYKLQRIALRCQVTGQLLFALSAPATNRETLYATWPQTRPCSSKFLSQEFDLGLCQPAPSISNCHKGFATQPPTRVPAVAVQWPCSAEVFH